MADVKKAASLADMIPQPRPVPLGDVTLMIAPMGWEQGCSAMDALGAALSVMPPIATLKTLETSSGEWLGWVSTFRDDIAEFLSVAVREPQETVKALPPTTVLELLAGVLEINVDFFVRSLPGVLERLAGRVEQLQAGLAGAASTTSSSA